MNALGFAAALTQRRGVILAELARAARGTFGGAGQGWEETPVRALTDDLRDASGDSLAQTPDGFLQRAPGTAWVALPIVVASEPFGIAVASLGQTDGMFYEQLRELIGAAFRVVSLSEDLRAARGPWCRKTSLRPAARASSVIAAGPCRIRSKGGRLPCALFQSGR